MRENQYKINNPRIADKRPRIGAAAYAKDIYKSGKIAAFVPKMKPAPNLISYICAKVAAERG